MPGAPAAGVLGLGDRRPDASSDAFRGAGVAELLDPLESLGSTPAPYPTCVRMTDMSRPPSHQIAARLRLHQARGWSAEDGLRRTGAGCDCLARISRTLAHRVDGLAEEAGSSAVTCRPAPTALSWPPFIPGRPSRRHHAWMGTVSPAASSVPRLVESAGPAPDLARDLLLSVTSARHQAGGRGRG